ncbi:hypothetical protein ACLB1E_29425 [Escherichia coli]
MGDCNMAWTTPPDLSLCMDFGSAALTATGPVLNVLPFGYFTFQRKKHCPELATRLAAQLKKIASSSTLRCRRIVRDSGRAGR